jgi:preprotein translocase subunit YajC
MRRMIRILLSAVLVIAAAWGGVALAQDEGAPQGRGGGFGGGQMVQGTVTAASADKLTIKTEQGEVYQVVTTANTRVMLAKDRQPGKMADVTVGGMVGAMGLLDAPTKTVHAMMVMVLDPEQVKKAREEMGKLYIVGKVMKIEDTTLTILLPDGVTQKIEVDEGTSFRRGGAGMRSMMGGGMLGAGGGAGAGATRPERQGPPAESITLMDVKVGDQVGGQGAVKNGVFVPKELSVMTPGSGRRRRGADGGAPAAAGAATAPAVPPAGGSAPAPAPRQ